jgi:hypothetical protein
MIIWLRIIGLSVFGANCLAFPVSQNQRPVASSQLIADFEIVTCEEMLHSLDYYAGKLKSDPAMKAYVRVYGRKVGRRGEITHILEMIKSFLVNKEEISSERIVAVDGGYRNSKDITVELWLWKDGTSAPVAKPTLNAKEVRFRGSVCKYRYQPNRNFCQTC